MTLTRRQMGAAVLVAVGAAACALVYPRSYLFVPDVPANPALFADDSFVERILIGVAAALALVPFTRDAIARLLAIFRKPSLRTQRWSAVGIFVFAQPLLYWLAVVKGRVLEPYWHDENFYRLQTTFLAHGKLVAPGLLLPQFFDAPYLFTHPIYAVAYFPGTALLHVPAAWLHLAYWVTPLVIAGIILALTYRIACEVIDGVAGWLAVILLLALALFRWMALIEMSHVAAAMWAVTALWAWLAWRKSGHARWVALGVIAAGAFAITRPFDAVLVLLPILIALFCGTGGPPVSSPLTSKPRRRIAFLIALILLAPFLALQLHFDRLVTGHLLQTPMGLYYRTYMNLHGIGPEHYDPAFVPPTSSQLVRDTYASIVVYRVQQFSTWPAIVKQWLNDRLPETFGSAMPSLLLIILIPPALIRLSDRRLRVIAIAAALFIVGYAFVFQYLDHYVMVIAPLMVILVLAGADAIGRAFPYRNIAGVFLTCAIVLLAGRRICIDNQGNYQRLGRCVMHANYVEIPQQVHQPAIVMFRYTPNSAAGTFKEEPVYNWDVVNPDDAPIIRCHDLGPKENRKLFDYYAKTQPTRNIYRYDRASGELKYLGTAQVLASSRN